MSDQEIYYTGKAHPDYKKRELLRTFVRLISTFLPFSFILILQIILTFGSYIFPSVFNVAFIALIIIIIILAIVMIIANVYYTRYIKNFSFYITDNDVIINYGVFRQCRASVPYCRVQNISITSTIFERRYNLFTINIETAGTSGYPYRGWRRRNTKGEGFIVGQKDPTNIEKLLKEKITVCLTYMESRDKGYI